MSYNAPAYNAVALQLTSGGYSPPSGNAVSLTLQDTSGSVSGVSAAFLQFGGNVVGVRPVTGLGSVSLSFYPTSQGARGSSGVADSAFSFTAAATGTRYNPPIEYYATVAGSIGFVGSVVATRFHAEDIEFSFSGDPYTPPTTLVSLDFGAASAVTPTAEVAAYLSLYGSGTGAIGVSGLISGELPFTAESSAFSVPVGTASSSFTFVGSGQGKQGAVGSTYASLSLSASAAATQLITGSLQGTVGLYALAQGVTGRAAEVDTSLLFQATASGTFSQASVVGNAITVLGFTCSSTGSSPRQASVSATIEFASPATGLVSRAGEANVGISYLADAIGVVGRAAVSTPTMSLYAVAFGVGRPDAVSGYSNSLLSFTSDTAAATVRKGAVSAFLGFEPHADASTVVSSTANSNLVLQSIANGSIPRVGIIAADLLLFGGLGGNVVPYWAIDTDRCESIYTAQDTLHVYWETNYIDYLLENNEAFEYTTPNTLYATMNNEDWYVAHQA